MPEEIFAPQLVAGSLLVGTPAQAIPHCQARIDAGIQYVIVATPDTADYETLRLRLRA